MSDIASLYIKVDSTGVVTASRSLDELAGKSQKVEEATRKVTKATDSAASSMGKYITAAAATAAVMKLIQQSVQAFMEAEKATLRMAMAMKNQGDFSRAALNDLKDYASQLQKVTAYEDDATLSLMANLKSYGMTNEEVKKATKVAMDFASAKQAEGMSVKTAAELLGNAYAGNTQTLARYGIVVGEIKDKSEKYNAVMKQLEQRFGGSAQAELLTYAGQWQKLKNQWSDIQEFLGLVFLKTLQAVQVAAGLVGVAFMSMASKVLQVLDLLMTPLRGILMLTGLIAGALGADGLSSALNLAASAISDARARILEAKEGTMAWTSANYDQLKSFDGIETAVEKMGNTGTRTTYDLAEGTDKATKAANRLREEADKINETLGNDIKMSGLDELEKKLFEIQLKYEKLAKNPLVDKGLLSTARGNEESSARWEARSQELKKEAELTQEITKAEEELIKTIQAGYDATMAGIQKQYDADGQLLRDKLELYKDLTGFEDEYRQVQLEWIERLKNENIKATGDVLAAEEKAAKERKRIEYDLFKTKTDYIASGFGQLQSAFTAIAATYDEGSAAANRWKEAAKGMEIAQKAVAVVQAVAAIATQGLGDPYTAFARIAAMAATMGALLASIGTSIGGAGGAGVASAPQSNFSSSVLGGEEGELSESLKKSWEYLEDTYDMEYERLTKIYNEMKSLNDNITGLVTSIIRTGSVELWTPVAVTSYPDWWGINESEDWTGIGIIDKALGWVQDIGKSILGGIFGGKTEYWSSGSGIGITGGSVGEFSHGGGTGGYAWRQMHSKKKGGWFHSDKYSSWLETAALDASVVDLMSKVYQDLSDTLIELTVGLGQDMARTLAYVFPGGMLTLDGMNAEQIGKAINEFFSAQADAAVQTLFGALLKGYQEVGESLTDTAVRLMVDKEIVLEVLSQTGQSYIAATDKTIAFSEALIKLAGDLDTLVDISANYYDKFFTDEEKHLRLQEQMTTILGSLNIALPASRQAYRDIVESLDLTTTSGQEAYITLLKLAKNADIYYSTLEDMADDLVSAVELAAQAVKDAIDATNTAISEQISLSSAAASAARSAANEYRNIIKSLTDAQESIRGGSAAEMQQRFDSLFAAAMTGDREALSALPGASEKLLSGSLATSKSAVDYARDQGKMLLALEQAKAISGESANWQEYQATLLETQVNVLEEIRDELQQESPDLALLEQHAGLLEDIATLLGGQTSEIITGNATQDVIKNIQNLNTAYSEEMLNALISGESAQTGSLEGILTATTTTVGLIRQLVNLSVASEKEKIIANIESVKSEYIAAAEKVGAAESALYARQAEIEPTRSEVSYAAFAQAKAEAEAARQVYQNIVTGESQHFADFYWTPEDYSSGTQFQGHGYQTNNWEVYSRHQAAWAAYTKEFKEARALMNYSAPDTDPTVSAAIQRKNAAENQLNIARGSLLDAQDDLNLLIEQYQQLFGERPPGYAAGGSFVGGLRIVGEQGPELEYTGPSHIVNASKTEAFMSSNKELVAEIKKLNAKIEKLEAGNYQIVKNTLKTAKTLEKFDYDGLPAERAA